MAIQGEKKIDFQGISSFLANGMHLKMDPSSTNTEIQLNDEEGNKRIELIRLPRWEEIFQPFPPETTCVAYQLKRLEKKEEYHLVLSSNKGSFHLTMNLEQIKTDGIISVDLSRILLHINGNQYYSSKGLVNLEKIKKLYPNIDETLLECIETVIGYRLYSVTQNVDVVWHYSY